MKTITVALVLCVGLVLSIFQIVSAHAFIDHCTPEVGSTVPQSPKELRCSFTDAIDAKQTTLAVYDAKNNQVDNKDLAADANDPDGKTVVVTLNAGKIADGLYTVKWSTVSEDGHATDGQFQFAVGANTSAGASTTPSGPAAAPAMGAMPASVTISSPDESSPFPNDPSDVPISIQTNNFALGQAGNHWQVYLDDQLAIDVKDNSTNATLQAVPKGDHALKIALVDQDNTVLATAGTGITVGPQDQQPPETPMPMGTPSLASAPSAMMQQSATTASYKLQLTLGPVATMLTPDQAKTAKSGEAMVSGDMGMTMGGMAPNYHLEVHLMDAMTGAVVSDKPVKVSVTDASGMTQQLAVATMYDVAVGQSDMHYGQNVSLMPGHYTIQVDGGGESATFQITLSSTSGVSR